MALITQNFHSPIIQDHYYDRKQLAVHFLLTIGAKALVLEEQKKLSHQDLNSNKYDGIQEEAEHRYKLVTAERIRSIKRKLLEKQSIKLLKCSRKGKYRAIDAILEHYKKDETFIIWVSKYNYVKKFSIDSKTHISLLEKPKHAHSLAQVVDISSISSDSSPHQYCAMNLSCSPSKNTQPNSSKKYQQTNEIIPIRFKNHQRQLDIFFYNLYELEAFLIILQKFSSVDLNKLDHLFFQAD